MYIYKMSSLCSVDIIGGLGNHLFQIAMLYMFAKHSKKKMIFKYQENLPDRFNLPRKTFWDSLFKNIEEPSKNLTIIGETQYNLTHFNSMYERHPHKIIQLPYTHEGNILFKGYFQSFKYIDDDIRQQMIDLVYSNSDLMHSSYNKYNEIKKQFDCKDDDMVSLHMRRTDFLWIDNYHYNLTSDYYKRALEITNKKYVVIFSDDIEWCKKNVDRSWYEYKDIYFVDINHVETEFILMSMFQHNIIANSTFSLWASFVSTYQQPKIIIAPKNWYGDKGHKEYDEVYHKYITHII
jgi:hypothetical protein